MNCAIIGMSIRLPKRLTTDRFWDALVEQQSFNDGMSDQRKLFHQIHQPNSWGDMSKVNGMYFDDIDCFDKRLFSLSNPALMFADPRQRLLLESCWSAIEDAGLKVSELKGKQVGVFLAQDGFDMSSYFHNIPEEELANQEFIIPGTISSFLASRIANVFDFKGPSMVVDGTCSSIYMAVHHACQALESGECEYALVGGATLFLEPWKPGEVKPTSFETGVREIRSFTGTADGYCSSEGGGAFLLTCPSPTHDARMEGYGTILATGYNSGGKTRSFAQPNQEQQEYLFRSLLKKADKSALDVQYIECHGIGSIIGDSVEANAFVNVFGMPTRNPCYVSTIKPNIGHAQASSGLYSLMKVILSLKHEKILGIKGLKPDELNPGIAVDRNGVVFSNQTHNWPSIDNEYRVALLSTYGASNVNAAILLQEAKSDRLKIREEKGLGEVIICLSAESPEQLYRQQQNLSSYLEEAKSPCDIKDLAYTLQVGRDQMRYRLVIRVSSLAELMSLLALNPESLNGEPRFYMGDRQNPEPSIKKLQEDRFELDQILITAFNERRLNKLAELWVNGVNIKWDFCYSGVKPTRLHLPTYPFAKEKYWLPKRTSYRLNEPDKYLHPLLHFNTSSLFENRFTSRFTGLEVFLQDHVVRGERVLPGVAYLELMRAAGEISLGCQITQIKNITWLNAINVKEVPREIHVTLFDDNGLVGFEVHSNDKDATDHQEIIHAQGSLGTAPLSRPVRYDTSAIQNRLKKVKSGTECYDFYDRLGLSLGRTYKGIKNFYFNDEESLSEIELPKDIDFVWQLGLLDSSFQTGDLISLTEAEGLRLPFCLKEVNVYGDVSETKWAYARKVQEDGLHGRVCSHDIAMLSAEGEVLLTLKGFITIPVDGFSQTGEIHENPIGKITDNPPVPDGDDQDTEILINTVKGTLLQFASGLLRLEASELSTDEELGDLGFDSIMMTRFTNGLNQHFKLDLLPTILYSYSTIDRLSGYLINEHQDALSVKYPMGVVLNKNIENHHPDIDHSLFTTLSKRGRSNSHSLSPVRSDNIDGHSVEPIAIIGINCRFPGSPDFQSFWNNIKDNKDLISEVPKSRWDWNVYWGDPDLENGKTKAKWGGFIENIDKFDPLFFGISPLEAELMDPQQRIAIEAVYGAFEDAAIPLSKLKGTNTGIFIGVSSSDYGHLLAKVESNSSQAQYSTGLAHSILTNRISYLLDIHGPSKPIDTACSSSLVAIHQAAASIRNGECEIAIAGGVNALLSPELTLSFSKAGMLSKDGKCKAFDQTADGYVRGEGVGIIILKSLKMAIMDGDQIHAVIRGSAENHGGKANTLTSPNPIAQRDLLVKAYRTAHISPAEVSYIETHGTGTSLGDPIESEGLKYAFKELYRDYNLVEPPKPHIKLGSVKTNIGHLEAAAGIAGLLKVILAMKNETLPGNPHLRVPNQYLQLQNSPFELQVETTEWRIPTGRSRIAGVSSFGFGGTNAHVVIEEYRAEVNNYIGGGPAVVLLSARDGDRLKEQVSNLLEYLGSNPDAGLYDIAYTLQVGRDAMEERVAFVVSDLIDLSASLRRYISGEGSFIRGNIRKGKPAILRSGTVEEDHIETAAKKIEPAEHLASIWVKGSVVDWTLLYAGSDRPRRISLPTYPFARERYWISEPASGSEIASKSRLHPLLHSNESNLKEQRYQSIYTGMEVFLSEHIINGAKVLPGVAYLELARAAGSSSTACVVTQLRDVVWMSPVQVNDSPQQVHISVYRAGEVVGYEIYTVDKNQDQLHNQGQIITEEQPVPPAYNLQEIQELFLDYKERSFCYNLFEDMGFSYGKSFQGIERLWYNETAALSKIVLPLAEGYVLSPGLLDSALQTCLGVALSFGKPVLSVPYSMGELNIYEELPGTVWCYVRTHSRSAAPNRIPHYDIDILNSTGRVLIGIKDFVALPLSGLPQPSGEDVPATYLYSKAWSSLPGREIKRVNTAQLLLIAGGTAELSDKLRERLEVEVELIAEGPAITYLQDVLKSVKTKLEANSSVNITLVYEQESYLDYEFAAGLLKTANQENARITGKVIGVNSLLLSALEELVSIVEAEQDFSDPEVRYKSGKREVKELVSVPARGEGPVAIKEDGVYLITGGTGGLGKIFATYISKVKGTKLILVGRGASTPEKQAFLSTLPTAEYYRCDVSIQEQVTALIKSVKEKYGRLNGIIHSAGVIHDSLIIRKKPAEVAVVLGSKITGARNLDEGSKDEAIDFMVFFSSMAGVMGNIGQADYASANAWLDNYGMYRNGLVAQGKRHGHTLSISWPLWQDGGMQIDAKLQEQIAQEWGMLPLPTTEGIEVFKGLLCSTISHALVVYGRGDTIKDALAGFSSPARKENMPSLADSAEDEQLREVAIAFLKEQLAQVLKLPAGKLNPEEPFERYGINSILITRLTSQLDGFFGKLPRTLFFEYQTLNELVEYFLKAHKDQLETLTSSKQSGEQVSLVRASVAPVARRPEKRFREEQPHVKKIVGRDIAIIGISGRYPGAMNLNTFWENLKQGRDCITEVPKERWDATGFYDQDKDKAGRSYSKWGGFIEDIDKFDPLFFNISPRDAEFLDPQERLFLQTAWETIEDAGYTRAKLQHTEGAGGRVGVYVGVMYEEYQLFGAEETLKGNPMTLSASPSSIANRVSYFLNLHGPSMAVDTMCSSSLTAIHLACEGLQNGSMELAIAGGVNLSVHPNKYLLLSQRRFMSEKGRCESFGEGGEGYVPGEGVGAVLLKPLARAKADGDRIYGVIKGSSINHGGKTNGYTVPNPNAQSELIKECMFMAGVSPGDFSYLEAHGTGTSLGDPIEIAGLTKAFESAERQSCAIGSVKSNIGHCESAAGISALTKVLLQLKYKQLVPSLHSSILNANIDFEKTPFKVQQQLEEWKTGEGKLRLAGISSFGAGGSNAHLIIEEYKSAATVSESYSPVLIPVSAKQKEQLTEQVRNLKEYLEAGHMVSIYEVAHMLQTGREAMEERLALICKDKDDLISQLGDYLKEGTNTQYLQDSIRDVRETVALLLSGPEGGAYLQAVMAKGNLQKIAQLWIRGVAIDWAQLYPQTKPNKVSLPTYPFEKTRYWAPLSMSVLQNFKSHSLTEPVSSPRLDSKNMPWKDFATYLLVGELDELVFTIANEIVNTVDLPGLIFISQDVLNPIFKAEIDLLRQKGAIVECYTINTYDQNILRETIVEILNNHISIEGVLYKAELPINRAFSSTNIGNEIDSLADFSEGLLNIDEALGSLSLDFFMVYSYSEKCQEIADVFSYNLTDFFITQFVEKRNNQAKSKLKTGITGFVNWEFYDQGNLALDKQSTEILPEVNKLNF
jgi:acyl transferase domain-containing protein/acyl carrier protein